ncbi:putative UDP-N-acetylglucosamine pyrophosphorylase [Amylocarpus encephaloides]|uniref:UDP-N-acetylglucosamine diphosphorylase n=1 Tax=Amylocarpus encephaloides TaxID=45428 RepID=A0A9P7Y905_9HELO|nr:putative UDP-N-acetylglucosamine pyrophosphorylase [Amylocarpus encephaloides]
MDTIKNVISKIQGGGDSQAGAPPREPSANEVQELKEKYEKAGQEQVFAFYDSLSASEQATLFAQLQGFDPEHINKITNKALNPPQAENVDKESGLKPLPETATASILDSKTEDIEKWYQSGLDLIADNKVGVVLMAGGQGTRLGSSAPKGCFNIGLPSEKSLFKIQAERIRKLQSLANRKAGLEGEKKAVVPWYVMTSGPTRGPTEAYFQENNYFGLQKENVVIFEQGVLPCVSNDGKILLESKGKVAVAPDGNGGIYQALITSNVIGDMRKRGIEHIHAYCVDNCLVKVADPVFIGFSASKEVDIATKVVRKRNATESVGLILLKNGKPDVVEYSEIDRETAEAKDAKQPDVLKFRAANIVNHYYSFSFLESIPEWAHKLPHHVARKKIPYVDTEKGNTIKPEKPNGIKLEQFVFDVFPMLELNKFACMEVKREDEFSPLKNAKGTGEDDPDTSKQDIMNQGKRWVQAAGGIVVGSGKGDGIEVSPLFSYGGEGLEELMDKEITSPAVLDIGKA